MTDIEVITKVAEYTGLSFNKLAKEIGLTSPQTFYDIKAGKHGISKELAEKIHARYLNINEAWLLTGNGEMLVAENAATRITEMVVVGNTEEIAVDIEALQNDLNITTSQLATIINDSEGYLLKCQGKLLPRHIVALELNYGEERISKYVTLPNEGMQVEVTDMEIKKTIVLPPSVIRDPEINIKKEVKAGNLDEYAKPTQDILPLHQGKVYTYCDDMEPEIRAGEPVLVRLLPSGIPVVPGEMYFVDMPSGGKIRYVEKEEEGKLHLKARNNAYGDIIIDRSEVQSLWSVVLILRTPRSMSMREATAQEMLANKDRHLDRLLDQMEKGGDRERMLIDYITKDNK
jgi:plasmid maintenance system antidote protein VapI